MTTAFDDEDCGPMPFQEKRAWLTLASAAAVYGAFVAAAFATPAAERTVLHIVILFTIAITVQGVLVGVAKPMLALRNPEDAKAPLDERDRSVARRAFQSAYVALIGLVVIVAMGVPYAHANWQLTFAAYLATIVADMVRMGATVFFYRRNHG